MPPFGGGSDAEIYANIKSGEFDIGQHISEPGRDFIARLLCPAGRRLSAGEALAHPWLARSGEVPKGLLPPKVSLAITHLRQHSRLQKAMGRLLADCMTADDTHVLSSLFDRFDKSGSGLLKKEDLTALLDEMHGTPHGSADFARGVLKDMDVNARGAVSKPEFLQYMARENLSSAGNTTLRDLFARFDDGSGAATANSIRKTCPYLTPGEIQALVPNSDGKLSAQLFVQQLKGLRSPAPSNRGSALSNSVVRMASYSQDKRLTASVADQRASLSVSSNSIVGVGSVSFTRTPDLRHSKHKERVIQSPAFNNPTSGKTRDSKQVVVDATSAH